MNTNSKKDIDYSNKKQSKFQIQSNHHGTGNQHKQKIQGVSNLPQKTENSKMDSMFYRTFQFAFFEPTAAWEIGLNRGIFDIEDSTDISSIVTKISSSIGLTENTTTYECSQVNAFRHVLWQASIASKYGTLIAKEAADSHEINPLANLTQRIYNSSKDADQTIDLLNNIIGRRIGNEFRRKSILSLAKKVLTEFYHSGLYMCLNNKDNVYIVEKVKLTSNEYERSLSILNSMSKEIDKVN